MRFLLLLKADGHCLPEMQEYDKELVSAGVLLAAERLHSSSHGARIVLSDPTRSVTGIGASTVPIAGFWLIQAKSQAEAIEWARRCPKPDRGEAEVEIREVIAP